MPPFTSPLAAGTRTTILYSFLATSNVLGIPPTQSSKPLRVAVYKDESIMAQTVTLVPPCLKL